MATTDQEMSSMVQAVRINPQHKKSELTSRHQQQTGTRTDKLHKPCRYCGRRHEFTREACPAIDKLCYKCNKKGHFARQCRSPRVHHTEEGVSDDEEVFFINAVRSSVNQPAVVTCIVNDRHKVVFEIDTGASCNILPLTDYIRATKDKQGVHIKPTRTTLTMHNNSKAVPVGKVMLNVERGGKRHYLRFFIMKSNVTPILGKSSCIGMHLVKILDCDTVHSFKETTDNATNFPNTNHIWSDPILSKYTDIFEGLGELPGEYKIQLNSDMIPVVNPPRRLPVALRSVVKTELDTLIDKEVITPVKEPTSWVSSMVVAQKKNGKIRICLDPQHLNKAIMRSHYPLPTIEEVATRLTNAKVFSVLDAKSGFWQVKLEESSSFLTTFSTHFGRFRCPLALAVHLKYGNRE